jgi:hypothetical protein
MTRRFLPRLLVAAATLTALVAAVTLFAGAGFAGGSAAQANYAPVSTGLPTIQGNAQIGQTLTASNGSWTYQSTPTYSYQWLRCDTKGNGCANISGATNTTYKVGNDDVNHTLRVLVTAHNKEGSTPAASNATSVVGSPAPPPPPPTPAGPAGQIKLPNGKTSIPASSVTLPARLIVDGIQYQPTVIRGRSSFLARFHVSDTRGYVVRDALVYALGIPYAWVRNGVEVHTDQTGWATITITPSSKLPRRGALMIFIRARVEGQDLLAGTSTRRLSQILIR